MGLSISDVARATGLSRAYIHQIEAPEPEVGLPSLPVLIRLAHMLEVTLADLLRAAGADVGAAEQVPEWSNQRLVQIAKLAATDPDFTLLLAAWPSLEAMDKAMLATTATQISALREHARAIKSEQD